MDKIDVALKKLRESKNLSKNELALKIGKSYTLISAFENKNSAHRAKAPSFEVFKLICKALKLTKNERVYLAAACIDARLTEENKKFIKYITMHKKDIDLSFLDRDDIKQLIKDRFYPLFDDEKVVELLYDTDVLHVLSAIHNIKDKSTQRKKIKSILSLLE